MHCKTAFSSSLFCVNFGMVLNLGAWVCVMFMSVCWYEQHDEPTALVVMRLCCTFVQQNCSLC